VSDAFPDEVDEALWDEACRRADAIRDFLKSRTGRMSVADVALLATELEISQATAYRLIKLFRAGGTVMSLVERKPGRPGGHRVLDDRREEGCKRAVRDPDLFDPAQHAPTPAVGVDRKIATADVADIRGHHRKPLPYVKHTRNRGHRKRPRENYGRSCREMGAGV